MNIERPSSFNRVTPEAPLRRLALILFASIGLLVAVLLAADRLWLWLGSGSSLTGQSDVEVETLLPDGWQTVPVEENDRLIFQAHKLTEGSAIAPAVTVLRAEKPTAVTAEEYTAELVEAAETGLDQLDFEENTFSTVEDLSIRRLRGQYQQGEQIVGLKQQMYIKGDEVYTFTGIFPLDSLASVEVELIFDQVLADVIGW